MRLDIFFSLPLCQFPSLEPPDLRNSGEILSALPCRVGFSLSESPCRFLSFFLAQVLVWYSPHYPHLLLSFHTVSAVWGAGFLFWEEKTPSCRTTPEIPPRFGSWKSGVSRGMIWMRGPTAHAGNPLGSSRLIALHRMLVFHCCASLGMGEPRDNGSSSDIALR